MTLGEEPIADRVGGGGIADLIVPKLDGDLAGDDRRPLPPAILQDLVEIAAGVSVERGHPPVVEDQDIRAGESGEGAGVRAVGTCKREFIEQSRDSAVESAEALADG